MRFYREATSSAYYLRLQNEVENKVPPSFKYTRGVNSCQASQVFEVDGVSSLVSSPPVPVSGDDVGVSVFGVGSGVASGVGVGLCVGVSDGAGEGESVGVGVGVLTGPGVLVGSVGGVVTGVGPVAGWSVTGLGSGVSLPPPVAGSVDPAGLVVSSKITHLLPVRYFQISRDPIRCTTCYLIETFIFLS